MKYLGNAVVSLVWTIVFATPLAAQVVRATASQLLPHSWSDASSKSRDRERNTTPASEAARYIALYAAPYLGTPGTMVDSTGVDTARVHLPAVHFVFSAAARLQPSGGEVRTGRTLKRLNAHVRIEALDSDSQVISNLGALEILDLQPNTHEYTKAAQDTTTMRGAAVTAVTRTLVKDVLGMTAAGRFGPVVGRFAKIFHHPTAPTQVSYVSDRNEFGWTWYEHSDTTTLEGLHRAAVLLETHPRVRFLLVQIQLITDWGHHGAWRREFESVIDLGAGMTSDIRAK
jgi:hypothetical protein